MKISIIIVSYNVKDYISQCIRSIHKSDLNQNDYEIIVVDNDSHDGSIDEIKDNFNEVILLKNDINKGFSKAVNKGISLSKGEYVCILNPDVIIQEDTLSTLLDFCSNNPSLGAVGPKILNSDGTIQHSCKRSFPNLFNSISRLLGLDRIFPKSKIFGGYNLTYLNTETKHEVDVISGAFMIVPMKVFKEIGDFDERFFMFGEDIDICHRIKEGGYKIYYNPITEIIHYKGESVKNAPFDMISVFYSAMDIYFKKYSQKYKYWKFISLVVKLGLFLRKTFSYAKLLISNLISVLVDTFIIIASFACSIYLWYSYQYYEIVEISKISYHYLLILNFIISWFVSSKIIGVYKKGSFSFTRIFLSIIITFLVSSTSTYFISFFAYSRGVLFISTIFTLLFMVMWRLIIQSLYLNKILFFKSFKNFIERRALMIGADKETLKIGKEINSDPDSNISIIGYTDNSNPMLFNQFLGKIDYIKEIVIKNKITEIIIRENYFTSNKIFQIIKKLKGFNLAFKIIPEGSNIILSKGEVENISGIELMSYEIPFLERSNIIIKRSFDIILSLFMIFLTFPLILLFYFLIGFKTERIWGLEQEYIKLKFIKVDNKMISAIPLLYQVFLGKLSVVGSELVNISNKNPNHILKPGLTTLIKTKKFKGNNSLRLESYYIKNQSLIFDIEIILKSLFKA